MKDGGHRWFAWVYDRMSQRMERGKVGELRASVLAGVSGDVVEIGAGTGLNFPHYPPGARVIAFEPDPHMLKRARQRVHDGIDLREGAAEHIPLEDASADVVVTTLVLCTVDDPARSLAEARRVLRPGGELRFLEHVRAGGIGGRVQDALQPVYGRMSGGCHWNRHTEQALAAAGFTITSIEHGRMDMFMPYIAGGAVRA